MTMPTIRATVALLLVIGSGGVAGCGQATVPRGTVSKEAKVKVTAKSSPASAHPRSVVARIDASSDAVLAEGKLHIAPGAPSDAEIRREIKAARKAGIVLPSGESAASFENSPSNSGGPAVEAETPETAWNPRSKPIADWIIPILEWASHHGWSGTVTSGYRTYFEQAQLNAAGAFSAKAGLSNHETTVYPGGAVDVTSPSQLITVLETYPGPVKLVGGVLGPVDPEHFSATGD
ncbi:MAG TPA: hypothetical protein VFC30_05185 [Solirubrobacteraceae bacterium]|nr:hypothetical protein [Solirubrobacteraceae bacterium]